MGGWVAVVALSAVARAKLDSVKLFYHNVFGTWRNGAHILNTPFFRCAAQRAHLPNLVFADFSAMCGCGGDEARQRRLLFNS